MATSTPDIQDQTNEEGSKQDIRPAQAKRNRWVKLAFYAIIVIAGVLIYVVQTQDRRLDEWPTGLDKAMVRAKEKDQPILVFFVGSPPSDATRKLLQITLSHSQNKKAIAKGKYIKVQVTIERSLDSDLVKRYAIKELPTMLILDSRGKELNRREGFIGEVSFRNGFLDCKDIQKP